MNNEITNPWDGQNETPYLWTSRETANQAKRELCDRYQIRGLVQNVGRNAWGIFESNNPCSEMISQDFVVRNKISG